jgi:hypothetical protein
MELQISFSINELLTLLVAPSGSGLYPLVEQFVTIALPEFAAPDCAFALDCGAQGRIPGKLRVESGGGLGPYASQSYWLACSSSAWGGRGGFPALSNQFRSLHQRSKLSPQSPYLPKANRARRAGVAYLSITCVGGLVVATVGRVKNRKRSLPAKFLSSVRSNESLAKCVVALSDR